MPKYRNLWIQVFLMIITLGLYSVYWFYATTNELAQLQKREEPVFLWTLLLLLFPLSLYSLYKECELFEKISPDMNRWLLWALWTLFPPAPWMIVQWKLNQLALESSAPPA